MPRNPTTKEQVEAQSKMILRLENRLTTLENKVADLNTIKNAATLASGRFSCREISTHEAIRVIRERAEKKQLTNGDALMLYGILAKREIS